MTTVRNETRTAAPAGPPRACFRKAEPSERATGRRRRAETGTNRPARAREYPAEQHGNVLLGVFVHLGPPLSCIVALSIFGVTPLNVVVTFVGVSMVFATLILVLEKTDPSVALPAYTARQFIAGMAMIFLKGVGVGGAVVTAGWWLLSFVSPYERLGHGWALVAAATFLTDLGYYWFHRGLSHGRSTNLVLKLYRRAHAAHHSVTALDFLRGNHSSVVDTAVTQFQPSLIVASYVLGLDLGATWAAYALILTLQATDHTSVTYNIGWLRYLFMDNHAHKLHHCRGGTRVNHGAAFSVFDRLWGTYREDWTVRASYLHHHRLALPGRRNDVERARRRRSRSAAMRGPLADGAGA